MDYFAACRAWGNLCMAIESFKNVLPEKEAGVNNRRRNHRKEGGEEMSRIISLERYILSLFGF